MEKTLGAILEEGAVKNGAKHNTSSIETTTPNLFIIKRTLELHEFGILEATAQSAKKKTAQHLAAGFILLQVLDTSYWRNFPVIKNLTVEEAKALLDKEIESLQSEGMTIGENPVGNLQNICKQLALSDPEYEYDFGDTNENPKQFKATCTIANYQTVTSVAASKKQAKANVAKDMLAYITKNGHQRVMHPKESEDNFQPALSNEKTKSPKAIKDEILREIDEATNSTGQDRCITCVNSLDQRKHLTFVFKKQVKILYCDHKSLDPSKMLRTLHIIDNEAYQKEKKLCPRTVRYSFIGIGENDINAKNDAARHLLFHVKNYFVLRVVD